MKHVRCLEPQLHCLYHARAARREWVEAALAAALHAHAGVAPADWRAYGRMAGLAADKFGLRLAPPALPPRSLSLGAHEGRRAMVARNWARGVNKLRYGATYARTLPAMHLRIAAPD